MHGFHDVNVLRIKCVRERARACAQWISLSKTAVSLSEGREHRARKIGNIQITFHDTLMHNHFIKSSENQEHRFQAARC